MITSVSLVEWKIEPWTADDHTEAQRTPDLSTLIEEIVNRDGWKPGNALAFMIKGKGERHSIAAEGGKPGEKSGSPRLYIELEEESLAELARVTEPEKHPYTVRLYFAEPDEETAIGDRKFNIKMQDELKQENFDILAETDGVRKVLVKEFSDVPISARVVHGAG